MILTLSNIVRTLRNYFERKRRNPIIYGEDQQLESNLKPIKIGDKVSPIQVSDDTVNVQGSLKVDGVSVSTVPDDHAHIITALNGATENELVTVGATTSELNSEGRLTYTANSLVMLYDDSTIGVADPLGVSSDGHDLDIYAGNAIGTNNTGGDLYLNAGKSTGNEGGGTIYFTSSTAGSTGSTLADEAIIGKITSGGGFRATAASGVAGSFICYNSNSDTNYTSINVNGLNSDQALSIDGGDGSVSIDDDGLTYAKFTSSDSSLILYEAGTDASVDYFKIACGANGATTITTVHAFATLASLKLSPDGQLILESGGAALLGTILCKSNLSIKESADALADTAGYGQLWVHDTTHCDLMFTDDGGNDREMLSGMILGYTSLLNDAADSSYAVQAAFAVPAADWKVTFVAPPSGNVEIFASVYAISGAARQLEFGLSDNATYNAIDVTHEHEVWIAQSVGDESQLNHQWVITGLTSGTSYTYFFGAKAAQAGRVTLYWGGDATAEYAPFIMKATALPSTIYEG